MYKRLTAALILLVTAVSLCFGALGEGEAPPSISIDAMNVYENMDRSFNDGYLPTANKNEAVVVLPLLCSSQLQGGALTVSANLGEPDSAPFVFRNYEKTVRLAEHKLPGGKTAWCYLAVFRLELKKERYIGAYPVTFSVKGMDLGGTPVGGDFSVYVSVNDGKEKNADPDKERPASLPKLMVDSYYVHPDPLEPGKEGVIRITIRNTSASEQVSNIKLNFEAQEAQILPKGVSSSYFKRLKKGGELTWELPVYVIEAAASKPHTAVISMEYEYGAAIPASGSDTIIMNVRQPIRLEYEAPAFPSRVTEGDNVAFSMNLMNMGKGMIYNVLATFEMPGMNNGGSVFVGELAPGEAKDCATNLQVTSVDGEFGQFEGRLLIRYENEFGEQQQKEIALSTQIQKKQAAPALTQAPEDNGEGQNRAFPWWIAVAGVAAAAAAAYAVVWVKKQKIRRYDEQRL